MRRVKYLVDTSNWNLASDVREGVFHGFMNTSDYCLGINSIQIVAMIETEDGSVIEVKRERIRFIKESYNDIYPL